MTPDRTASEWAREEAARVLDLRWMSLSYLARVDVLAEALDAARELGRREGEAIARDGGPSP